MCLILGEPVLFMAFLPFLFRTGAFALGKEFALVGVLGSNLKPKSSSFPSDDFDLLCLK